MLCSTFAACSSTSESHGGVFPRDLEKSYISPTSQIGKTLHCEQLSHLYKMEDLGPCDSLGTLDRTVPILWTLRPLVGMSNGSLEAQSFVSFGKPCQLASSIPPDREKCMPLSVPIFAFLFSFAVEDGNVRH